MKRLFLWLIVANLAVAAVIWLRESPAENTRLKQQLNPDKIRPVSLEKATSPPPRSSAQGKSGAALVTEQKSADVCFEWGKISSSAASRAEKALASLKTENRDQGCDRLPRNLQIHNQPPSIQLARPSLHHPQPQATFSN